jgi:hypothetical protein
MEMSLEKSKKFRRQSRSYIAIYGGKMHRYSWVLDNKFAAMLALIAIAILTVAWPMENVLACTLAVVMVVAAAGILIRTHFQLPRVG